MYLKSTLIIHYNKSYTDLTRIRFIYLFLFLSLNVFFSCQYFSGHPKDHPKFFDQVLETATNLKESGKIDSCFTFLNSKYKQIKNPGPGDLFRKYNFFRYYYLYEKSDFNKAIIYTDSCLKVLEKYADEKLYYRDYATANFYKGDVYFELKKYTDAFQSIYKGKLITEKIKDPCFLGDYDYRLAMVCYKQLNYLDAVKYFKKAINDFTFCKEEFVYAFQKQQLYDNIGLSFSKVNMLDSAHYYYNCALDYIDRIGPAFKDKKIHFETAKAVIYGNLAEIFIKMHLRDTAEQLLKNSISINVRKGYANLDAQLTQIKLADLYIETNRFEKADQLLKEVRISLDTLAQEEAELRWRRSRWQYFDKTNQTDKAYRLLQSYIALRDTIKQSNIGLMAISIDDKLDNFERDHQFDLFKRSNELKNVYIIAGLIFSILIIILLFITWRNWKKTNGNLMEMSRLNKLINYQKSQLENTVQDLEQSNKDKDRIMKVIAHDLNNPISAIVNISDLLLFEDNIKPEHKDLLKLIKTSSTNSIEMINDLVEALLNTSEKELKISKVDINKLIKESVDLLQFKADEKNQKIVIELKTKEALIVNREKIMRVIINLIVNAIKFSPSGETIIINMERNNGMIRLSVIDNGIGIPDEIKDNLFDMFTKAKRLGTAGEQSFGLGLSISKKIIDSHKGLIGFQKNNTKGSIFYFELPL